MLFAKNNTNIIKQSIENNVTNEEYLKLLEVC